MKNIVAVILAGGQGKRLHMTTPKPLVKVAGKRCIDYIIEHLQRAKVKDIILALYFKPTEFTHQDLIHSGGIYIFNKEILAYIPHNIPYSIHEDLIPELINKGVPIT